MNLRLKFGVGFLIVFSSFQMLAPQGSAESTDIKLKVLMHSFLNEMEKLRPFLSSEKSFGDPKAQKTISAAIEMLQNKAMGDTPETIEKNSGFRLNFGMLKYHFRKTKEAYDLGALELARQNLNATGAICLGCHSQLPKQEGKPFLVWAQLEKSKKLTLEAAEYLFVMRNFDGALAAYDELVQGFPKNQLEASRLPELYRRKLALLARVQRDPVFAIKNLTKDLSNAKLPADIREELKSWIGYFQQWQKESVNPETLSTEKLLKYVKESIPEGVDRRIAPADPDVVRYLRLSGLIYERLLREPGTAISQELVFRLAVIEKQLSKKYWYSLHQAYLRECVIGFPKSATSKICFDTYVKDIEDQFAGRSQIPPGAQSTIDSLRKYVE
jgi:hypothetical protein